MKRALLACLVVAGCKGSPAKMSMTPDEVIAAMRDFADRGCACSSDKECFREIRTEWEGARRSILFNADLLKGADRDAYQAERTRFGLCGDGAGLAVFDNV